MSKSNKGLNLTGVDTLGLLISESKPPEGMSSANPSEIPLQEIYRPQQHRKFFNPAEIEKLKKTIAEGGFKGAVLVSPLPDDHPERTHGFLYELVYGGSRYQAMQELGRKSIPAEIKKLSPAEIRRARLDENLIRADLNPLEEAEGLIEIMADVTEVTSAEVERELNAFSNAAKRNSELPDEVKEHLTQYEAILKHYNKGELSSFRTRLIKYRSLPDDVSSAIAEGKIDASKALELGSVKDRTIRNQLLDWVIEKNPSVQEIRKEKRNLLSDEKGDATKESRSLRARVTRSLTQLSKSELLDKPTPAAKKKLEEIERLINELLQE